MKRPLAGLLASAAAMPCAWLLARADDAKQPFQLTVDPDIADEGRSQTGPVEQLAAVEPIFDPAGEDFAPIALAAEAVVLRPDAPMPQPAVSAAPDPAPTPDLTAATPPPTLATDAAAQATPQAILAFVAEPVVQPLPAPSLAARPDKTETAGSRPTAAVATNVEAHSPAMTAPYRQVAFIAEPVIQSLPVPIAAVPSPVAVASMPEPTQALARQEAHVPQALTVAASAKPVAVLAINAAPLPPTIIVSKPANPTPEEAPAKSKVTSPDPSLTAVPPAKAAFPAALAVAAISPKPIATAGPEAQRPKPPAPSAPILAAASQSSESAPPPPASKSQLPITPPPAPKLPVGEVVLAAYSPTQAQAQPIALPPEKVRNAMVEPTAARTVQVGAPAPVAYPEPAFGQPEAKLIPAALSTVEPTEQPTSLGAANSLAQAIAYSYETNPRLLAERASTRAADLGFPAARAAFGPRLDASASLSYTRDRDEILPGSFLRQQGWSDTASLILSQPLLTFGRSQARVGQAAANIDFRRESLRLVQNEVMLDVIGAYVGTLREAGAVTIARENVALLQRQLDDSNARFAVREITLADVQQVETRLSLGKTVLLEAQARLGEVQARFYRAVGMPPGELTPPEPLTLPVNSLAEAYSLADNESPLVRAAQARERISRSFLAASRAESAPRVDFRGSADYGSMSDYSRDLRGTRVRGTVTLSVPLFDSGARSAESGQAREANTADLQLIAAAQRDSRTAVATGWNNVLAARLSIDHYRQAVESAQRAYENGQRQERAGMRTTQDVLDLARDLLNVRNAYNAALADEYQARAALLATLGQLDPGRMSGGLKLYDPADHFRKVKGKGDVPLLTGSLAALDGVVLPNLKASRPSPDAAALVGTAETVTGK
jgi:TolC family type I secretion outer membrane protein